MWFVMPPGVTDSMMCKCKYDLLMTCFLPLPARYWYTLAEVQCFRSFNVVHHGNWFAPVRWRLGIRKQHQNGVVSPFLQLCQRLTIQVVKRDRTDVKMLNAVLKSGTWAKVQQWNWHKPNGKTWKILGFVWGQSFGSLQQLPHFAHGLLWWLESGECQCRLCFAFPSFGRSWSIWSFDEVHGKHCWLHEYVQDHGK